MWKQRTGNDDGQNANTNNNEPMVVVYRLAGLDGEATEDIVDEAGDLNAAVADPEVEFRIAAALAVNGGIGQLLRVLGGVRDFMRERALVS